jgi:hypothetical protein
MKTRVLRFQALDGKDVSFPVPKSVNPYLAEKAIKKAHQGHDADLVYLHLTRSETEFVAEVIATLEEHRPKAEAAS